MDPGAFLAVLIAAAALPSAKDPAVPPDWQSQPTAEDIGRLYPVAARERVLSGRAVVSCTLSASGRLVDCKVAEETPAGYGFGEAAVKVAGLFVARPQGRARGQSLERATVELPIAFRVQGWVDLRCAVDIQDRAADCRATTEHPPGRGFGAFYASATNGVAYSPNLFRRAGDALETTVSFEVPIDSAPTP